MGKHAQGHGPVQSCDAAALCTGLVDTWVRMQGCHLLACLHACTAGLTKMINHFLINDSWHLVDLPGYGWVQCEQHATKVSALVHVGPSSRLAPLFLLSSCTVHMMPDY